VKKPTKVKQIAVINILTFKVHFNNICKKLFLQLVVQKFSRIYFIAQILLKLSFDRKKYEGSYN